MRSTFFCEDRSAVNEAAWVGSGAARSIFALLTLLGSALVASDAWALRWTGRYDAHQVPQNASYPTWTRMGGGAQSVNASILTLQTTSASEYYYRYWGASSTNPGETLEARVKLESGGYAVLQMADGKYSLQVQIYPGYIVLNPGGTYYLDTRRFRNYHVMLASASGYYQVFVDNAVVGSAYATPSSSNYVLFGQPYGTAKSHWDFVYYTTSGYYRPWDSFQLYHMTDSHVDYAPQPNGYDDHAGTFGAQMDWIRANKLGTKLALIVNGGDAGNTGNALYGYYSVSPYTDLVSKLYRSNWQPDPGRMTADSGGTIPVFFTPGNHDFRTTNSPPQWTTTATQYHNYISRYDDFYYFHGNALIIGLSSGYDTCVNPVDLLSCIENPEGSGLTQGQFDYVKNLLDGLDGVSDGRDSSSFAKIILMHHPIVNLGGTKCDGTAYTGLIRGPDDGSIANRRTQFIQLCDDMKVHVVLTGHVHQGVITDRYGNALSPGLYSGKTLYVQTGSSREGRYRVIELTPNFNFTSSNVRVYGESTFQTHECGQQ
ncbi:MAG: metallophosphoesterase [Acidobacteria bacterium]|nr:metallophosphoesterase [Acidobacteriota bacterium]